MELSINSFDKKGRRSFHEDCHRWLLLLTAGIATLMGFALLSVTAIGYNNAVKNDSIKVTGTCTIQQCDDGVIASQVKLFIYAGTVLINLANAFADSNVFLERIFNNWIVEYVWSGILSLSGNLILLVCFAIPSVHDHTANFHTATNEAISVTLVVTSIVTVGQKVFESYLGKVAEKKRQDSS